MHHITKLSVAVLVLTVLVISQTTYADKTKSMPWCEFDPGTPNWKSRTIGTKLAKSKFSMAWCSVLDFQFGVPISMLKIMQARALVEIDEPDEVLDVLTRLVRAVLRSTAYDAQEKRNIDLGFSRGFSGSQAAKHLMGLAAANFAGGPGRRRRSPEAMEASALEE